MAKQLETFTVASSGEDLRFAARIGDLADATAILDRYKGDGNDLSKFLPAVAVAADSHSGNKALHLCAANGHLPVVELLLAHDVDVDATNQSGSTALHYAALNGQIDVVKALIKSGAQPVVENMFGKTALDEARAAKKTDVAELLIAHVETTGTAPDLDPEDERPGTKVKTRE